MDEDLEPGEKPRVVVGERTEGETKRKGDRTLEGKIDSPILQKD